jgi:hypothetical protein
MKLRTYMMNETIAKPRVFEDDWTLNDENGEDIHINVKIHYESSGGKGRDLYFYPLKTIIAKTFRFDGRTYERGMEFPEKLEKSVTDCKRKKFDEWLYDRVNEHGR